MATDASPVETNEFGNRNKLVGKGELQPMSMLKPQANSHTITNTSCGSHRELTSYSFQPFSTIPVRSSTSSKLMASARSTWPKALLVPSIEPCNLKSQSVPLNIISILCRYSQRTKYQRKCDIGRRPQMQRPRKPSKSEIGTNWSARRAATDAKAKTKGQLPHHHYHELWVAT